MKRLPMGPAERSEVAQALRKLRYFDAVSDDDLGKVAGAAHLYALDGFRNMIFKKGHKGDALYIVRKGIVDITKPRLTPHPPLSRLGPGQAFGELAVLKHPFRTRSAVAEGYTELFVILVPDLEAIIKPDHHFHTALYNRVQRRRIAST